MDEAGVTRRALLVGALTGVAGVAGVGALLEADVLPGRSSAYRALGLNHVETPMPTADPGPSVSGRFTSSARAGAEVGWTVSYPRGFDTDAALPVLLMLHSASSDHTGPFAVLGMDRFLTLALDAGVPPFAIAAADGGPTFWRPLPGQGDSSLMLTEEFLPLLSDRGLRTDRLVVGGWSMGGYGALRLAGLGRVDLAAATVMSPALTEMGAGAPDDVDVAGHPERFGDLPLRVDCGRGDGFYPVVKDFVDDLPTAPETSFGRGGHTPNYWRSVVPEQLRFAGEHLA